MSETAVCTTCSAEKPLDDFSRRAASANGRQPKCKGCQSAHRMGRRDEQSISAARQRAAKQAMLDQGIARCVRCGETKSIDLFNKNNMAFNGRESYCRPCRNLINDENGKRRGELYLLRTYGLTRPQIHAMLDRQNHRCLICSDHTDLVVDHDHTTGAVRGLLCRSCNTGIGLLKDNIAIMQSAIAYLSGAANAAELGEVM